MAGLTSPPTSSSPSRPTITKTTTARLTPLTPFTPDLYQRAWASTPHPSLPLLATSHAKSVTVFSLASLSQHSALTGGHSRSVRCTAWKPGLPSHRLCLVTGSFDSTAGLWRWDGDSDGAVPGSRGGASREKLEVEITAGRKVGTNGFGSSGGEDIGEGEEAENGGKGEEGEEEEDDWEFTLVLEGHENEIKGAAFSPSGQYLATCSRDKSVWIWEDVGVSEADDEWETVAVLNEHDGDVKAVAWCPDVPGRNRGRDRYSPDVLASASYDNTVRVWREDGDGEWVCVAVLEGHEGTVWGLQWEPAPGNDKFPRLLTFSADTTIRIWTLRQDEQEEEEGEAGSGGNPFRSGFGAVPNTMRRSLREDWDCTAVLPSVHTRDIYSAAWSASGLVASTGSDGVIAVYGEEPTPETRDGDRDGDATMTGVHSPQRLPPGEESTDDVDGSNTDQGPDARSQTNGVHPSSSDGWRLLGKVPCGHGPYEVNHITWCKRFDPGARERGVEEMLVTSGDDGVIRPWQVETQ